MKIQPQNSKSLFIVCSKWYSWHFQNKAMKGYVCVALSRTQSLIKTAEWMRFFRCIDDTHDTRTYNKFMLISVYFNGLHYFLAVLYSPKKIRRNRGEIKISICFDYTFFQYSLFLICTNANLFDVPHCSLIQTKWSEGWKKIGKLVWKC